MANIPETPAFDAGVYQIETTDKVLGGPDGKINVQAQQLANRTAWLKQEVEAATAVAAGANNKADSALAQIADVEAATGSAAGSADAASQYKDEALAAKALAESAQAAAEANAAAAASAATGAAADRVLAGQKAAEAQASATTALNANTAVQAAKTVTLEARDEAVAAVGSLTDERERAEAAAAAAEQSEQLALGYLNDFKSQWYGPAASDPTTDPQGNPPTAGDAYFNTALKQVRVFNGASWEASFAADDSSSVSFQQAGSGAVATTVQSKLREMVSVLDFGADPTYTTDSTAAFQAAIMHGAWNGTDIFVPNGTYKIAGTIFIGAYGGSNCYSVTLRGESAYGSVLLRPAGAGTGPIITMHGFQNVVEKFTLISEVSGGAYSASHGLYIRGNPQADTAGVGTKYCSFRNLKIYRVGTGIQMGNYDVDGKDPDIETNNFEAIEISNCNVGVFVNGQNILHNPFYACHIVDCRDQLAKQTRGADLWFERCYFGGMYDYLTNNYNVASSSKILVTSGLLGLVGCRSEDWASSTGNATSRFAVNFSSSAAYAYIAGNTFTTRDNSSTEPSCSFAGSGTAGSIATRAVLVDNEFDGYVSIDTIDIFSLGNRYKGTGGSVVNGRILSANQKTANFRDVFLDSNQEMELPGVKFKRNSGVPVKFERAAVATGSEFLGQYYYDELGLLWGRIGKRITNGTAAAESSVMLLGNRMAGAFVTCGVAFGTAAPTAGTWARGDRVFNSAPAVGQPKSWVCTVAGSPGTWVSEGNL